MFLSQPSILVTDDDAGFRQTLCGVLEPEGFKTYEAADGEEALKIVGSNPDIHLLLLDMHMPRLTGLETVRRLKQMHSRLPCILLSAALDDSIRDQARKADVYSVLSKPVTRCDITSVVIQALRRTYGW